MKAGSFVLGEVDRWFTGFGDFQCSPIGRNVGLRARAGFKAGQGAAGTATLGKAVDAPDS
jgi:hypothetical protein